MANEIVNPQVTDAVTQCNSKTLTFKEVCQAVAEGKQLQARGDSMPAWHDIDMATMNYIKKSHQYRIKPEDKYEPWTFATCPREGWIRFTDLPRHNNEWNYLITSVHPRGMSIQTGAILYQWEEILKGCEYSPNGIDGWRPAGRKVAE